MNTLNVDDRELAHILACIRVAQSEMKKTEKACGGTGRGDFLSNQSDILEGHVLMSDAELDALCQKLNGPVPQEDEEKIHKITPEEFAMLNKKITEHTEIFLHFESGKNYFDVDPSSSDLDVDLDDDEVEKLEEIGAALTPRNVASGDLEIDMPKREIRIHAKTLIA